MAFNIKKRGKLTYYYHGEHPVLSALVTEEMPDGDLKIYFAGLTGGYSAKGVLNLPDLVTMDPAQEIPLLIRRMNAQKFPTSAGRRRGRFPTKDFSSASGMAPRVAFPTTLCSIWSPPNSDLILRKLR